MQALQQLSQMFLDVPTLMMLLEVLGKAIHTALQQQEEQPAAKDKTLQTLVQQLPSLTAAFDQTCSAQATNHQPMLPQVTVCNSLFNKNFAVVQSASV